MVTHPAASQAPGGRGSLQRHIASWLAALVVPSVICIAVKPGSTDSWASAASRVVLHRRADRGVAGRRRPRALSAQLSGMLLNYFRPSRYTWTIARQDLTPVTRIQ